MTVDGVTHTLPRPFFVIATQNPLEHHGTHPLPESQLDRFLMWRRHRLPRPRRRSRGAARGPGRNGAAEARAGGTTPRSCSPCSELAETIKFDDSLVGLPARASSTRRASTSRSSSASRRAARSRCGGPPRPGRSWTAATTASPRTCATWRSTCSPTASLVDPRAGRARGGEETVWISAKFSSGFRSRSERRTAGSTLRRWLRPPRTLRPTRAGWIFFALTFGVGFAALNTGNNLLYLVLSLMLAFLVLSGVLSESALRGIRVRRRLPRDLFAGTSCSGGARDLERAAARARLRGGRGGSRHAKATAAERAAGPRLRAAGRSRARPSCAPTAAAQRGAARPDFHGFRVSTRFPFGLFSKSLTIEAPADVAGLPGRRAGRASRRASARARETARSGRRRARHGAGAAARPARVRADGDSVRRIHWRCVAAPPPAARDARSRASTRPRSRCACSTARPSTPVSASSARVAGRPRRSWRCSTAGDRVSLRTDGPCFAADTGTPPPRAPARPSWRCVEPEPRRRRAEAQREPPARSASTSPSRARPRRGCSSRVASATLWITQQLAPGSSRSRSAVHPRLAGAARSSPSAWQQKRAGAQRRHVLHRRASRSRVALRGGPSTIALAHFAALTQALQLVDARPRRTEFLLVALALFQVVLASNLTDSVLLPAAARGLRVRDRLDADRPHAAQRGPRGRRAARR